jgi:LmbE family N-acetylglucosaminyl deacetylase
MLIAGTLHRLCLAGAQITLLCATRGENGAIRDPSVADRATVGAVRSRELEAAGAIIGIASVLHFSYPDGDLGAYTAELSRDIGAVLRTVDPALVITFGPDGVTGHNDHIAVGRVTTDAVIADPRPRHLCHLGLPRPLARRLVVDYLLPAHEAAAEGVTVPDGLENVDEATREAWFDRLGSPPDEFDIRVDVSDLLATKAAVFRCHASQPGSDQAGNEVFQTLFAEEFFRSVFPPGVAHGALTLAHSSS